MNKQTERQQNKLVLSDELASLELFNKFLVITENKDSFCKRLTILKKLNFLKGK